MEDSKVLDSPSKGNITERPNVVGTKKSLKKEHGGIHGMVSKYLRFMVADWDTSYNTPIETFNDRQKAHVESSQIDEIRLNYQYYLAQQENSPYAYLTEWSEGNELPAPWTNGHEIYQTVQHMLGPVIKHFSGTTITVESLDPSVQSIKQSKIAMLEAKKKLPKIFEAMAAMGANFLPEGEEGMDIDTALEEVMRKPSHKIERYGMDILSFINNVNSIKEVMPRRFRDVVIGRYCGMYVDSSQSRIQTNGIRPEDLIWDRSDEDDDFNRYSLFKGFISWKTKEEIVQAYKLDEEAIAELDKMYSRSAGATTASLAAITRGDERQGGFSWVETGQVRRIACVTGYFVASIDPSKEDSYNTLYQGTLIGDTVLVDYGESENQIYDMMRPEWPIAPIFIYSPDTILGRNVCPVDRFRQMQSDCDSFMNRVRERIAKDLGKVPIIWAESIGGDALTSKTLMEDLKRDGMTVLNRSDGEEPIINGKPVEMLDLSLDPNIKVYIELRKEMFQDMKDVVSQSRITTGMQQTYIGGGTQQQTISQASNGTVGLIQGFFQYFAHVEHYLLNLAKTMLLDARNEAEAELMFSEASREFWKSIKGVNVEDLQVRVEMEDYIDDDMRVEMGQVTMALAQNSQETGFDFLDWLDTKKARTATELYRLTKESLEKKKAEKERIRQEDMAFQQQQQQQQLQFQAQENARKEQNSKEREIIRQTPNMGKNQIEQEKVNLERNMALTEKAGLGETL